MNSIEPVSFEIEGADIDLPEYEPRITPRGTDWNPVTDYILNEAASERYREFSRQTMLSQFTDIISKELDNVGEHLPGLVEKYKNRRIMPYRARVRPIYHQEDITLVPNIMYNGLFYLISNNKEKLRSEKEKLLDNMRDIAGNYHAMGLENINIYHGQEFTKYILEEMDAVTNVRIDDTNNEFEDRIYRDLEPMSEAFVHNVTISFDSPQEPEYDVLFSLGPHETLCIEVEDHSGTDNNPSENDVIDDPSSEAGYIGANCAFTVLNGVDRDLIEQWRPKSELTDVTVLEENQCPESIFDYINSELVNSALNIDSPHRI